MRPTPHEMSGTIALSLQELMLEYTLAQQYSVDLVDDLSEQQVHWRPDENSSAIGWHLGHQAAVNHYLVRNLTAAEPSFDVELDALFDSATPEPDRGNLPTVDRTLAYRDRVASSTRRTIGNIIEGDVGAAEQLGHIADGLLRAIINHEYQHAKWIDEVRSTLIDVSSPRPASQRLSNVEGYWMIGFPISLPR